MVDSLGLKCQQEEFMLFKEVYHGIKNKLQNDIYDHYNILIYEEFIYYIHHNK
jgi:hypothetical protein